MPGVRRRAGGRRVYGHDELERLRFIQRLKALGLSLAEISELNAVYAIGGSTRAHARAASTSCSARHLRELDARIAELDGAARRDREVPRARAQPRRAARRAGARDGSCDEPREAPRCGRPSARTSACASSPRRALFDGHDAAINIMRRLLQAQGAEVIHLGHDRSVDEIVEAARPGGRRTRSRSRPTRAATSSSSATCVDRLRERGAGHVRVYGGGGGTIAPRGDRGAPGVRRGAHLPARGRPRSRSRGHDPLASLDECASRPRPERRATALASLAVSAPLAVARLIIVARGGAPSRRARAADAPAPRARRRAAAPAGAGRRLHRHGRRRQVERRRRDRAAASGSSIPSAASACCSSTRRGGAPAARCSAIASA